MNFIPLEEELPPEQHRLSPAARHQVLKQPKPFGRTNLLALVVRMLFSEQKC
jgi:hypothetical protein